MRQVERRGARPAPPRRGGCAGSSDRRRRGVQVDVLGQELPVAVPARRIGRARVVGGNDHGDRCGQLHCRRVVKGVDQVAVRGHAVVPVAAPTCSARCSVQLTETVSPPSAISSGGDLGVAAPGQLDDGGAPGGRVAEQLRAEEHPPDARPARPAASCRLHGERGTRGVAPQQDLGQAAPVISAGDLARPPAPSTRRLVLRPAARSWPGSSTA